MTIVITPVDAVLLMLISDCKFYTVAEIKTFCEAYGLDKLEVGARIYDLWQEGILKMRESDKVRYALKKSKAAPYQQLAVETAAKQQEEQVEAVKEQQSELPPDMQEQADHLQEGIRQLIGWLDSALIDIPPLMADGQVRDLDQITIALGMGEDSKSIVKTALRQLSRSDALLIRKKAPNGGLYMLRSIHDAAKNKRKMEREEHAKRVLELMADGEKRSTWEILGSLNLEGSERRRCNQLIADITGPDKPLRASWDGERGAFLFWIEPEQPPAFDAETQELMQSIVLYELLGGDRLTAGELFWVIQSNIPAVRELGANFALLLKEEACKADGLIRYDAESTPSGYTLSEAGKEFMARNVPTPQALKARRYAESLGGKLLQPGLNQALAKPYLPAAHLSLVEVMQFGSEQRVVIKGQVELTLAEAAALRGELQRTQQDRSFWSQYAYGAKMIKETTTIKGVEFTDTELSAITHRLSMMNFPTN